MPCGFEALAGALRAGAEVCREFSLVLEALLIATEAAANFAAGLLWFSP